jgi:glycosyltransferase involved in cell wall biosynthesis
MVSLRIAIAGTRGIPPRYGGFETFAAELSTRLVARGHEVAVYCREAPRFASNDTPHVVIESPSPRGTRREGDTERSGVRVRGGAEDPLIRLRHFLPRSRGEEGLSIDESDHLPKHWEDRWSAAWGTWHGVERIVLPAFRHKYFETVSHTMLSGIDALRRDFDVVLLCNAANSFILPLLRAARIPVAVNVDGIERRRRKWNVAGRAVYAAGESFSALFATRVVADAQVIADYYRKHYGVEPATIPYGAEFPAEADSDVLQRLGVASGNYILYVSRFEPENNPLEVVLAYEKLSGVAQLPELVMLGSASYDRNLEAGLRRHTSDRVLFPGALYGRDYRTLQRNALVYIQATEVGGTHPAMIEAMASGGCVLAHDTPENREVGGDTVRYFRLRPDETLAGTLRECLASPAMREQMRAAARARAGERYGWTAVTDAYERLFAVIAR